MVAERNGATFSILYEFILHRGEPFSQFNDRIRLNNLYRPLQADHKLSIHRGKVSMTFLGDELVYRFQELSFADSVENARSYTVAQGIYKGYKIPPLKSSLKKSGKMVDNRRAMAINTVIRLRKNVGPIYRMRTRIPLYHNRYYEYEGVKIDLRNQNLE